MTPKLKPLDQQVMVITGASSGIGLATARSAAKAGARVVLVARSGDAMAEAVAGITADGGQAAHFVADVGDEGQVRAAAAFAAERFGRIDTWVNNAGTAIYAKLADTRDDEHRQLFQTNYFGCVHGCQAAIPLLRESGGALITVASVAADMPSPIMGAYAASKHAVKAYVESLRIELAMDKLPISVSLIKPSGIDTPVAQHATNHVGGEAQIPPPPYDPKLVADAILHAATKPTRDLTVGGAGRAQVLFANHFPGLFDKLAPLAAKAFVDLTKAQPGPSNLFAGAQAGRVHSGERAPLKHSAYTSAAKHPAASAAIGLGMVAGATALVMLLRGSTPGGDRGTNDVAKQSQ